MPGLLPSNARSTSDVAEVFRRLAKYHGIDPAAASERLHRLKRDTGQAPDADLVFDLTGNVWDPRTLEWIGSLTSGGKP